MPCILPKQSLQQAEEDKLSLQIEELRSDLDARRTKLKRLTALNNPATIDCRQQDMKQAAEALEKAKAHADTGVAGLTLSGGIGCASLGIW